MAKLEIQQAFGLALLYFVSKNSVFWHVHTAIFINKIDNWTFLVVRWLRINATTVGGVNSVPVQRTKIYMLISMPSPQKIVLKN